MLVTKINPVGLDRAIQEYQQWLYRRLVNAWALDTPEKEGKYECYGRCYRNRRGEAYYADIYTGSGEYKEPYWSDKLWALSFFGLSGAEGESTVGRGKETDETRAHLVFFVNLDKLKPGIAHRADEEVRQDVLREVTEDLMGFTYLSTELWAESVLKEYPGSRRSKGLSALDMHPIHCFRINFLIRHDIIPQL